MARKVERKSTGMREIRKRVNEIIIEER